MNDNESLSAATTGPRMACGRRCTLRHAISLAALAVLAAVALPAAAQDDKWPSKPIRIVVPGPAGSYTDNITRPLADHLRKTLGQTVIIDNKAGANSAIGAADVARSAPDGYTLLVTNTSSIAVNPQVYKKLTYSDRDFAAVTPIVQQEFVLVVNPEWAKANSINSVSELLAWSKAHPGKLRYASSGIGNLAHLLFALIANKTGVDAVHVPYKGFAPAQLGVMSGEVEAMFDQPSSAPHFESGRLKPLAVTAARRNERLASVPTLAESGLPGIEANFWMGMFVPARTPPAVIAKVAAAVRAAALDPVTRAALAMQGEVFTSDPDVFAARVKDDIAKWGAVIKRENLSLD